MLCRRGTAVYRECGLLSATVPPSLFWLLDEFLQKRLGFYVNFGISIPVWLYAILPVMEIIFGNRGGKRVRETVKVISFTLIALFVSLFLWLFGSVVVWIALPILLTVSAIVDRSVRGMIKWYR